METLSDGDGDQIKLKTKEEVYQKYLNKISKERPSKPPSYHPKFGQPKPLESDKLPTYCELAASFLQKQSEIRHRDSLTQSPSTKLVIDELSVWFQTNYSPQCSPLALLVWY